MLTRSVLCRDSVVTKRKKAPTPFSLTGRSPSGLSPRFLLPLVREVFGNYCGYFSGSMATARSLVHC